MTFLSYLYLIFHQRAQRLPQLSGLQQIGSGRANDTPQRGMCSAASRTEMKFAPVSQGNIKRILNREGLYRAGCLRRSLRRSGIEQLDAL